MISKLNSTSLSGIDGYIVNVETDISSGLPGFDIVGLPDASGYSLLETLSREDAYSFPPVIVYTGRELSVDEEQREASHHCATVRPKMPAAISDCWPCPGR